MNLIKTIIAARKSVDDHILNLGKQSAPKPSQKHRNLLADIMSTKDLEQLWNDKKLQKALVG